MKEMFFADKVEIAGTRRTADGYLVTDARVARGGNLQDYYGHEIGEGEPNQLFRVWRPETEIFKRDSLATFAHKPVTLGHPTVEVTPESWRRDAIGHVGSEVVRDGEFVRVPLVVMDGRAIDQIEAGTREISMGYDCELVMEGGTTPDGRTYDAYQRNIRINHCAIVPAGRAGPQCRIGDSAKRSNKEGYTMAKSVTIDGKAIEVADNVAALLADGKLGEALTAAHKAVTDALSEIATLKTARDAAEGVAKDLKTKLDAAEKAVVSDKDLADKIAKGAAELALVIDAAAAIAPNLDTKGKAADTIKREAVAAKQGEDAVKDKSADYISATFDLLAKFAKDADPLAAAMANGIRSTTSANDAAAKAASDYEKRQMAAWQH